MKIKMDDTSNNSNAQKKNRFQQFYNSLRSSFFNIMFELLKEKNTSIHEFPPYLLYLGIFLGSLIILIMFIQLVGLLFDPDVINTTNHIV